MIRLCRGWKAIKDAKQRRNGIIWLLRAHAGFNVQTRLKRDKNVGKDLQGLRMWALP